LLMRLYYLIAIPILRKSYCLAICKTGAAKKYLEKKGLNKTKIIPVGVNISLFYPTEKKHNESFELLTVGSLIPIKNYNLVLEVFK
ncbi:MAG: hypothetical protein QXT05_02680, partial [Candidatus Bilamarchaeaceae archaeon]